MEAVQRPEAAAEETRELEGCLGRAEGSWGSDADVCATVACVCHCTPVKAQREQGSVSKVPCVLCAAAGGWPFGGYWPWWKCAHVKARGQMRWHSASVKVCYEPPRVLKAVNLKRYHSYSNKYYLRGFGIMDIKRCAFLRDFFSLPMYTCMLSWVCAHVFAVHGCVCVGQRLTLSVFASPSYELRHSLSFEPRAHQLRKLFLLLHNCNFDTIMNCSANIRVFPWSRRALWKGRLTPSQGPRSPACSGVLLFVCPVH